MQQRSNSYILHGMHKKIIFIMTHIVSNTLLTVAFILGIGITAIIMRLFKAVFLKHSYIDSAWETFSGSSSLDRMF